jgi:hypothetical protein
LIGYTQQPFILNTVMLAIACGLGSGLDHSRRDSRASAYLRIDFRNFDGRQTTRTFKRRSSRFSDSLRFALRERISIQSCRRTISRRSLPRRRRQRTFGTNRRALSRYRQNPPRPEHFVENQLGKNPHDKLKPAQSSKIIISHVTYGIKLGKRSACRSGSLILFRSITARGRCIISYAKRRRKPANAEEISENDFRYPGPKPQFKEAAIMMIADSCEAAARSGRTESGKYPLYCHENHRCDSG